MAAQARRDAEQVVPQPRAVGAAVRIDQGEGLEQDREVPGEQGGPHPHRVHAVVARG